MVQGIEKIVKVSSAIAANRNFSLQDYNARQYVAYTISNALGTDVDATDVLAVSAMEAVGVSLAFERYRATAGAIKVSHSYWDEQ